MNLVKEISAQLSGGVASQLGSLLGTDADTTERAAGVAVPSLLSALAGMTQSDEGSRALSNTLQSLDTSWLGNLSETLSGSASSVLNKGSSLLGSLLGDNMTSGLASALSRFTGMNANSIKTLLAYLTPLVLGKVATHWKNQGGTTHALQNLFATQRDNIASALPPGLSLNDIPGASFARQPSTSAVRTAGREPVQATSLARWLLPLAAALVAGFLLWQWVLRPGREPVREAETVAPTTPSRERVVMRPEIPTIDVQNLNLTSVRENLTGVFRSLDTTLTDIRDAASAEQARSRLSELNTTVDSIGQVLPRLSQADRTALRPMLEDEVKVITQKANAVNSLEGVGPEIKTLIQEILTKITAWLSSLQN
jgi:hypothetical protein